MILANETVAEFMERFEMPFIYRVHEKPGEEKAESFKAYLSELGVKANFHADNVRPGEYGKILDKLEGGPLFHVVNRVMLRSMSKARYSAENSGHFGLASSCYCHFTSPSPLSRPVGAQARQNGLGRARRGGGGYLFAVRVRRGAFLFGERKAGGRGRARRGRTYQDPGICANISAKPFPPSFRA